MTNIKIKVTLRSSRALYPVKCAAEVLRDGTIRVPNFDSDGNKIGMATLKVVNGVLTVTGT